MIARVSALAVLATLVTSTNAAVAQSVAYTCGDGTRFTAVFVGQGGPTSSVEITGDGAPTVTLPQVKSADGGRYASGDVEFWIRGREATFTRGGRKELCRSQ